MRAYEAKLYVDDEREPDDDTWTVARSSSQAITYLKTQTWDVMSLDHDLGGDDTSRSIILWLCDHPDTAIWPDRIKIHTANPVGRRWLEGMINRYAEEGTLQW